MNEEEEPPKKFEIDGVEYVRKPLLAPADTSKPNEALLGFLLYYISGNVEGKADSGDYASALEALQPGVTSLSQEEQYRLCEEIENAPGFRS